VFAPTDAAFSAVGLEGINFLLRNTGILADVLKYHVVSGTVLSTGLSNGLVPTLLADASLTVSIDGGTVMINDATVTAADNVASNGVIHIIDKVLVPASVTFPPDIAGTVVAAGATFATLLAALQAGDLVDALSGAGPFTVFAPSEAAFANLPAGALLSLLLPKNKDLLVRILQQHVVSGDVKAAAIIDGMTATALNGETLTFAKTDDAGVTVNGVSVVDADILALNGVIHVVDEVLIPDGLMIPIAIVELAVASEDFSTLASFLTAADLIATLSGDGPFSKYSC
jgi:transforming growth factor-beta-induced protein